MGRKKGNQNKRRKPKSKGDENSNVPKKGGAKSGRFSAKKKKEYLKEKRQQKKLLESDLIDLDKPIYIEDNDETSKNVGKQEVKPMKFVSIVTNEDSLIRSLFVREDESTIEKKKLEIQKPLNRNIGTVTHPLNPLKDFNIEKFTPIEIPLPPSKEDMKHSNVAQWFKKEYLENIKQKYGYANMNFFEMNVNVWQELWRALELSDILYVLTDIRHPLIHFPISLYKAITEKFKKPLILILNKCDLVSVEFKNAWVKYLRKKFGDNLKMIEFSSYESARKKHRVVNKEAIMKLFNFSRSIMFPDANTSKDSKKEENGITKKHWDDLIEITNTRLYNKATRNSTLDERKHNFLNPDLVEKKFDKILNIGMIGQPNTGKSTLINTLLMDSQATVSMTPGKTKKCAFYQISHNVKLIDSPGLIFPIFQMDREAQVLTGLFPIAQVRVPVYTVQYVAERMFLEDMLKLKYPKDELEVDEETGERNVEKWTSWLICDQYAEKKNFKVKRGQGRNDVHRGANFMLREIIRGKILVLWYPPGMKKPKKWFTKVVSKNDKLSGKTRKGRKKNLDEDDYFQSLDL